MNRRALLLSATTLVTGLAGCNREQTENRTSTSHPSPKTTESPTRKTPPQDFAQEWVLESDKDWMELHRETEYPTSDEAVNWTPEFVRTAEYAHMPSRRALESTLSASDIPPINCAVLSKWALPAKHSITPADFVAEVRGWFTSKFGECSVNISDPENVEPSTTNLDSGVVIGKGPYEGYGDTGRMKDPFQASISGESVEVERMRFEAGGVLFGHLNASKRVGYLAGGGWANEDSVTIDTVEAGEKDISADVSGKSWNLQESLLSVLNDVDQQ